MRASSRRFSSSKGTAGRATRDVSSRNSRVSEKGMTYTKVGSCLQGIRSSKHDPLSYPLKALALTCTHMSGQMLQGDVHDAHAQPLNVTLEVWHWLLRRPPKLPHLLLSCIAGSAAVWSSRQSMNSMASVANGWLSTSHRIPYAPCAGTGPVSKAPPSRHTADISSSCTFCPCTCQHPSLQSHVNT